MQPKESFMNLSRCFLLSSVTGVLLVAGLAFEKVAHAESEGVCQKYAQAAVDAFRQNEKLRCGFTNTRWQANFQAHFNWCRTAAPAAIRKEEELRGNQLRVCQRDPKAVACNAYATNAVADQQSNLSKPCGFTGGRWQATQDDHLGWCLSAPAEAANNETAIRSAMLGVCAKNQNSLRCDSYARQAVAQVTEANARGCGFSGQRWTPSYEGHLTWCIAQQDAGGPASETRQREGPLSQCRTLRPLPGQASTPPADTCAVSVTVKNQTCLNADGTPSSMVPGSSSAPGCGSNANVAFSRAKLNFASSVGCLSEGSSPAAGCCTYTQQTTQGCLCR
jgi:hypothetical protein